MKMINKPMLMDRAMIDPSRPRNLYQKFLQNLNNEREINSKFILLTYHQPIRLQIKLLNLSNRQPQNPIKIAQCKSLLHLLRTISVSTQTKFSIKFKNE